MAITSGTLIVLMTASVSVTDGRCLVIERGLSASLAAGVEKEPESTVRTVFDHATSGLQQCPDSEGLAYLRVRAAELGGGMLVGDPPPGGVSALRELTAQAADRFPTSARILAAYARVSREPSIARRAVAADAHYVPGRVVLADILLDSGNWREAEAVLGDGRGLDATSDGLVVFARIALEKRSPVTALARVREALTRRQFDVIEPDARDPRPLMRAHAIAGLADLQLNRFQDAAVHLLRANPEDPLVRDLLRNPPAALARALRAQHGAPR